MKSRLFHMVFPVLAFGLVMIGCKNTSVESNIVRKENEAPASKRESQSPRSEEKLAPNEVKITRQKLGNAWAFTVDEGILSCIGANQMGEVIFKSNGNTYAVNGTARGSKKYLPIDEIWADDPDIKGAKKDIGALINEGLSLCH